MVPPVALDAVPNLLKQADMLLSTYADKPGSIVGSKILEYCAAGKPVLLHGPKVSRDRLLERKSGARAGDTTLAPQSGGCRTKPRR